MTAAFEPLPAQERSPLSRMSTRPRFFRDCFTWKMPSVNWATCCPPPPVAGLNDGVDDSSVDSPTWIGYWSESPSTV